MYGLEHLYWENKVIRHVKKTADLVAGRGEMRTGEWRVRVDGDRLVLAGRVPGSLGDKRDFALDVRLGRYEAKELAVMLPRDVSLLTALVSDPYLPVEARAKILEVIILRGAHNEASYDAMKPLQDMNTPFGSGAEIRERRENQVAARDAVLNADDKGKLFAQLSRSTSMLPTGRYPATEWMNTMLREGGLMGTHDARNQVKGWLLASDPEPRGRAMFHLRDAAEARDEPAKTTGVEVSAGPVGFGLSWENAQDKHWKNAGDHMLGPVKEQLTNHPEQIKQFSDGYRGADRNLPVSPSN